MKDDIPGFVPSGVTRAEIASDFDEAVRIKRRRIGEDLAKQLAPNENLRPPPPNILTEANEITGNGGARNDSYDHPMPNFSKIAAGWSIILGTEISPRQVALMMIWMKVVRDNHKAHRDNLLDIAGYARCAERLDEWLTDDENLGTLTVEGFNRG